MDDASNPFAPLTAAELAEAARQSEPARSRWWPASDMPAGSTQNPLPSRPRASTGESRMASGATPPPETKPPATPPAGTGRMARRHSVRFHGRSGPAGNSRLGRTAGRCSTCPISSRSRRLRSSFVRARRRPRRRRRSFPAASSQPPAAAPVRRPRLIGRRSRAGRS